MSDTADRDEHQSTGAEGSPASSNGHTARTRPVRVALLNDFDIIVHGLVTMLAPFDDIEIIEVHTGESEMQHSVDVALFDTYGRRGVPWDEIERLVGDERVRNCALFTFSFGEKLVQEAMGVGVRGYLWKGIAAAELAAALGRVADGETVVIRPQGTQNAAGDGYRWPFREAGLTPRESEVLALLAEGLSNRDIATSLYLSPETVKTHTRRVFAKLGVHSRAQAVAHALRNDAFARQLRRLSSPEG